MTTINDQKVSWKSVRTFLRNPKDRHTHRRGNFVHTDAMFLARVMQMSNSGLGAYAVFLVSFVGAL